MFDAFFVHHSMEAALARIEEYRAAGVTTPVLMPLSFAGSTEERLANVTATIEALAPVGA